MQASVKLDQADLIADLDLALANTLDRVAAPLREVCGHLLPYGSHPIQAADGVRG